MKLNISLKQVFFDIFQDKRWPFKIFIFVIFACISYVSKLFFNNMVILILYISYFGLYFILFEHNVINYKNKGLPDLLDKKLLNCLKIYLASFLYGSIIGFLLAFTPFNINLLKLSNPNNPTIILVNLLLCLPIILSSFTTFAETLFFKEIFNFKKAFASLKYAWKDYIAIFLGLWTSWLTLFLAPIVLYNFIKLDIFYNIYYLLFFIYALIIHLISIHLTAQAYRYSLSKMNEEKIK